jgi:hypothetical protein
MKTITPIILAGLALAFCGCTSADGPIFSSDATKATGVNAQRSVDEQARDINSYMSSGNNAGNGTPNSSTPADLGQGGGNAPVQSMQMNPYGH